ncbi:hypothetical protein BJ166DRAFT_497757 [Pestalotiopsis sp. NC0098]|nr:hypothetical protein BJ166DRAFT_497757 [Pestalotiopsis sp. NC0098]
MHAPEECRGPLTKGTLEGCALCGRAEHITDDCGYWLLLPQNKRTSLKRYLYIFARQGLPPLASRKDFTAQKMDGIRPPLCPITATHYEHKQNQLDRQAGQYQPYHARFNYDALADTHVELARLPEEDPCLGKWKTSGPPPNRLADWEGEEGELPYNTPEKAPNTGGNPADAPEDHSEAKEDPHIAEWEEIYLREEGSTDSLAKLSPGEARKIENEHERDGLQPPQSPFLAPQKRKLSMTCSDFKKHEENGDQQEGRPEKLLKVEDIVVDASESDPSALPPDVDDLEHADHDDQHNITTELEFWCPGSPECSSDEETTGPDFDDALLLRTGVAPNKIPGRAPITTPGPLIGKMTNENRMVISSCALLGEALPSPFRTLDTFVQLAPWTCCEALSARYWIVQEHV